MKTVLFVCVHNAGRSVMAEAFFNDAAPAGWLGVSAGTVEGASAHPSVVAVMREAGLDVSDHRGIALTEAMVAGAERVITMGCAVSSEACPAIRYADVEDWGLPDPADEPVERVREIRDEIRRRVRDLVRACE